MTVYALDAGGEGPLPFEEVGHELLERACQAARFVIDHFKPEQATELADVAEADVAHGAMATYIGRKKEIPAEDPDEVAKRDGVNRKGTIRKRGVETGEGTPGSKEISTGRKPRGQGDDEPDER